MPDPDATNECQVLDPLTGRSLYSPVVAVRVGLASAFGLWTGYVVSLIVSQHIDGPIDATWPEFWRASLTQALPIGAVLAVFSLRSTPERARFGWFVEAFLLSFVAWVAPLLPTLPEAPLTNFAKTVEFAKFSFWMDLPSTIGTAVALQLTGRFAGQHTVGIALALPLGIGSAVIVFDAGVGPEMLMAYMIATAVSVPLAERLLVRLSPSASPVPPQ